MRTEQEIEDQIDKFETRLGENTATLRKYSGRVRDRFEHWPVDLDRVVDQVNHDTWRLRVLYWVIGERERIED